LDSIACRPHAILLSRACALGIVAYTRVHRCRQGRV